MRSGAGPGPAPGGQACPQDGECGYNPVSARPFRKGRGAQLYFDLAFGNGFQAAVRPICDLFIDILPGHGWPDKQNQVTHYLNQRAGITSAIGAHRAKCRSLTVDVRSIGGLLKYVHSCLHPSKIRRSSICSCTPIGVCTWLLRISPCVTNPNDPLSTLSIRPRTKR